MERREGRPMLVEASFSLPMAKTMRMRMVRAIVVVVTYAYASSLVSGIDRSLGSEMRVWVALLLRYFRLQFIPRLWVAIKKVLERFITSS